MNMVFGKNDALVDRTYQPDTPQQAGTEFGSAGGAAPFPGQQLPPVAPLPSATEVPSFPQAQEQQPEEPQASGHAEQAGDFNPASPIGGTPTPYQQMRKTLDAQTTQQQFPQAGMQFPPQPHEPAAEPVEPPAPPAPQTQQEQASAALQQTLDALSGEDIAKADGKTRVQAAALTALVKNALGQDDYAAAQLNTHGFELIEKVAGGLAPDSLNKLVSSVGALVDSQVITPADSRAQQTDALMAIAQGIGLQSQVAAVQHNAAVEEQGYAAQVQAEREQRPVPGQYL